MDIILLDAVCSLTLGMNVYMYMNVDLRNDKMEYEHESLNLLILLIIEDLEFLLHWRIASRVRQYLFHNPAKPSIIDMVNNGTQKKSSVLLPTLCWEMATVATGTCNINFTQYRALRYLGEHVNDNFSLSFF